MAYPISGFDDRESLMQHLQSDMSMNEGLATEVADLMEEESEAKEGDPSNLLESIKDGAKNILTDLGLETVSWVKNPSQDSMFVMMKNSDNRVKKSTSIYKNPEKDDWETVYGPVMRPNDIDKDGDIATTSDIEKAAHEFMAEGRVKQFDTDHDLNTGKGTMVESWILKEDKEYELPDGSTENIEEGSWMVGVQPSKEVKERIKSGDITGWSIFGQAEKIELEQNPAFKNFNNDSQVTQSKGKNTMGQNTQENTGKEDEELSLKDVHSELTEFKEAFNEFKESPEPATVKSVEELKEYAKSEEKTSLVELGKDFELETTEKEDEFEDMASLMDYLEDMLNESNFSMLMDGVRGSEGEMVEEEMDEDEEDEDMEADSYNPEKTAKSKGGNGEAARESQNEVRKQGGDSRKSISFKKQVEKNRQEA